jgi:phenylpyruvate tautomerase PptA (4-oxalocrotonate tautomerase family)
MNPIECEIMRPVTSVVIDEAVSGDWGNGGKSVNTNDGNAPSAGQARS